MAFQDTDSSHGGEASGNLAVSVVPKKRESSLSGYENGKMSGSTAGKLSMVFIRESTVWCPAPISDPIH